MDVVEAGFPCQAFSQAGSRRGFADDRGALAFEFARAVGEIRPRVVIGENVRGLLSHDRGRTFASIVAALEGIGYDIAWRVLRARHHDVPQSRERVIILGGRRDAGLTLVFPEERPDVVTLRDALDGVPDSPGLTYTPRTRHILAHVPPGGNWRDLPPALAREHLGSLYRLRSGATGAARRLAWDEPAPTLLCTPTAKLTERCHPAETRPLTIREYARIQTFPDEWVFAGSRSAQYTQIGNAMPVNLAYHIGRCVIAMLDAATNSDREIAAA